VEVEGEEGGEDEVVARRRVLGGKEEGES